jgi:SAM-dependent methyltransferase
MTLALRPSARAFDAIAPEFDLRFGAWRSVAAQRDAVRSVLLQVFPADGHILEVGGGTGEDAAFLATRGFGVFLTDPAPEMVSQAKTKLAPFSARAETEMVAGEDLEQFAADYLSRGGEQFDGAFSNFAPLNCISDLKPVAHGLAQLLKPGAATILVLFGTCCPGEFIIELLRGRQGQALRRFKRGEVQARIARREFVVRYHRCAELERAFAPWFVLERRLGIGVAVPPSAAEPWISKHPRVLASMVKFDQLFAQSMAIFGDHILYQFRRTSKL